MASLNESSLQLRLEKRKGTISEVDRPLFEKQQTECITKAIRNEEVPAKEKHVRRTIIGTWQERGNSMFWMVIGRQPLPSQAVMCWKALTVLHKILREGHPNVLKDSYIYRKNLKDLLAVYKFQGGTYSSLITEYLKVLQSKVDIHHKYPGLPGGVTFTAENPVKIPGRDINDVFTFALEILDYQDLLLSLEENIFLTLDKSKNNSNIPTYQCKIAALVPILKESSGMYDVLIQVLTRLHKNLPPDTLDGLRQRFYDEHKKLKLFCVNARSLSYITNLTSIPKIPEQPPDFLIHKFQPKVKREEPKEEPALPAPIAQQVDERDILIEQLMMEINELREHLDVTINQGKEMENHLRMEILRQKEEFKRIDAIARQATEENDFLREQLEASKEDGNAEKMKSADEKFNKLKILYGKLRQDHIDLLRKNAEIKQKEDAAVRSAKDLQENLDQAKSNLAEKEKEMANLEDILSQLNAANQNLKVDFNQAEQLNNSQVQNLKDQIGLLTEKLDGYEDKIKGMDLELEASKQSANEQIKALNEQLQDLSAGKITEESARKNAEDTINKLRSDQEEIKANLEIELAETKELLDGERMARQKAEERVTQVTEKMNTELSRLKNEMADISKSREELEVEREKLQLDGINRQTDLDKQISDLKCALEKSKKEFSEEVERRKALETDIEMLTKKYEADISSLSSQLEELSDIKAKLLEAVEGGERKRNEDVLRMKLDMLSSTASECEKVIKDALELFNDPKHESGTTCSAEFLQSLLEGLPSNVQSTTSSYLTFNDTKDDVLSLIALLNATCHQMGNVLVHGKATSHMTSPEDCRYLVSACRDAGKRTLNYINELRNNSDSVTVQDNGSQLEKEINNMIRFVNELIPKQSDLSGNENIVEEEMHTTEKMVEEAAARIEEMLNKSRKDHSGVQLEVNERILDTCTALMKAIRELILRSKDLQDEIVADGRGTASVTEFYKRHHKWAEGLLSAAKSVGWGATILVEAADKVIERKGKFEELIVASHEIAASTAQLVAASRVKASKNSPRLPPLMTASKHVGEATAGVVAAVRSGASLTEESKTVPDYSKMSLTQAKRWEMDSQVKILELDDLLQKERAKLGQLRKAHYQIAVELYGEDQVLMD